MIIPLSELLSGLKILVKNIDLRVGVTYISRDSRDIPNNGTPIFFAIKGQHVDANLLIDKVLQENQNTIIVSENEKLENGIIVKDLSLCMPIIARRFFRNPDDHIKTVAITGTNGKTTISFLMRSILNTFSKTGLFGTIEYDFGDEIIKATNTTPMAVDFYKYLYRCKNNGCKNVVFEASSHAIDQNRIYDIDLDVAIFTNLSQDHLDYHKTFEQYFYSKKKLFDGRNGKSPTFSIVNFDDNYGKILIDHLKQEKKNVISYGEQYGADFQIINIDENIFQGSTFWIKHHGVVDKFSTKLFGRHNIANITASVCAMYCLGYQLENIRDALSRFDGVPGRLEKILLGNGALVFIDYAHTPAALEMVLNILRPHANRLITVFGCGGDRDRTKRVPMTSIVAKISDFSIATADNPRSEPLEQIFEDMKTGLPSGTKMKFITDRKLAIETAIKYATMGDIILIAGRGHENEQKVGNHVIYFNDKEVVKAFND